MFRLHAKLYAFSPAVPHSAGMRTYRDLFRLREFSALFAMASLRYAAATMTGLALATAVFKRTGSPLLSALAMFGTSFGQLVGAATLLSAADRTRPRRALPGLGLAFAVATFVLALPGIPVAALLAIELATGLLISTAGGIQWGLIDEVVPDGGYVLARSAFNLASGVMQVVGFAVGGALVADVSARATLLAGAAVYLLSAAVVRGGLSDREPRAGERPSIARTWAGNARLLAPPPQRALYLAAWVPNGLIVGCEALFIAYAPHSAAWLFAGAAVGMLAGDLAVGRFIPARRRRSLIGPLRLLLAVPYLLFAATLPLPLSIAAVGVASFGYSASLLLQERLLELVPDNARGHALGLQSAGTITMQAVGATLAGLIAQRSSPATAMTIMASASVLVTLALTPSLAAGERSRGLGRPGYRRADARAASPSTNTSISSSKL
jgi:predicted MFS family arabinose efflux permease